ncbi:MAG: GspMb/PilO family protein [Gemmatimonadaceae bacterium]|nr:GspMb/PilO family protein [Gemmatimonadaceae bacterium]
MKLHSLSTRDRRALLLGAFLVLPAILYALVARPYVVARSETNDRLSTERSLLSRELALLSAQHRLTSDLTERGRSMEKLDARFFHGVDATTAAGALASYVAARARVARVAVNQVETRDGEEAGAGLITIGISIRAEGDLEGVLILLRALETGDRLAWVEDLVMERGAMSSVATDDSETLNVSAVIKAFAVTRGSPEPATRAPERHGAP